MIAAHFKSEPVSTPAQPCAKAVLAQTPVAVALDLALITDMTAFEALEAEWNALFDRAGRPTQVFQTFNWNWHWTRHYLGGMDGGIAGLKLSVVTGRRDGRLVMVWPLAGERVRGIRQIFWMGEPVSQYGDVLIDDSPDALELLRAGWTFLRKNAKGDIVRLRRVRSDAVIAPLMAELGATISARLTAPYLDLKSAATFEDYEQRYSSHARRNRRRLLRRLEEQGKVTFERWQGGSQARALAVTALELKAEWLKSRGLVSHAISDARMARFFADAAGGETHSTNCIVTALKVDGEPAALEVSFTCKGRLAMHVIVFNLKFEKSGAGVLLLEKSIRDGYASKLEVYDMLAPGDNYKLDWADASADVLDFVKPLTIAGHAYGRIYLGFLRARVKSAVTALPPSVRRIMTAGYSIVSSIL
jgi:CelD/BcsL family acetyltransferase involved in cellulose biosynthesis